jgi:hypothetical protein
MQDDCHLAGMQNWERELKHQQGLSSFANLTDEWFRFACTGNFG